jgi:SAM-dependent methyltransferase
VAGPSIGAALWHDLECGSYDADLPLWRELADAASGPVLEIGCGTGRAALDLAAHGHHVTGLDANRELTRALAARAGKAALPVTALALDARSFVLGRRFALAIAPMQLMQLLGGPSGRGRTLTCVRAHLEPGGVLAAALADPFDGFAPDSRPPLPSRRHPEEWALSSTPIALRSGERRIEIDLHRRAISPSGGLSEEVVTIRLDRVEPDALAREGAAAGFRPLPHRHVPETHHHVGSTVVMLQAPE